MIYAIEQQQIAK